MTPSGRGRSGLLRSLQSIGRKSVGTDSPNLCTRNPKLITSQVDTVNPDTRQRTFDPLKYRAFQFLERSIDQRGEVRLRYALLGETPLEFEEKILLRAPHPAVDLSADNVQGALSLLHWVAGISYYKAAAPDQIEFAGSVPTPATSALLEALYSEGLGEFAFLNKVPVPKPGFPRSGAPNDSRTLPPPKRVLVPVGGGKDSSVAGQMDALS